MCWTILLDFLLLNPVGLDDWGEVMDQWGSKMLAAVHSAAQLAAVGLGLQSSAFTSLMTDGPHLLAPTGAGPKTAGLDLVKSAKQEQANRSTLEMWLAVACLNGCMWHECGAGLWGHTSPHDVRFDARPRCGQRWLQPSYHVAIICFLP